YILKILDVDFYFPHPREKEEITSVETIKTRKIFEDYIVELLAKGHFVEVYTFFSSAALTVANLQNVKVSAVVDNDTLNFFLELYNFFEMSGVQLVELDNIREKRYNSNC
ncbi:glycosyltransferase family 52, partial [Acinetobacter baumannii]